MCKFVNCKSWVVTCNNSSSINQFILDIQFVYLMNELSIMKVSVISIDKIKNIIPYFL